MVLRPERVPLPTVERVVVPEAERAVLPEARVVPEAARVTDVERVAADERVEPEERGTTEERVEAPETERPADLVARMRELLREADDVRPRDRVLREAAPRALKLSTLWPRWAAWLRWSRVAPPQYPT